MTNKQKPLSFTSTQNLLTLVPQHYVGVATSRRVMVANQRTASQQ
jgi:hypothetical protein